MSTFGLAFWNYREIHTCHVLIWKIQLKSLCPASKAPGKPIALFGALHAGSQSWQRLPGGPGWIVSYSVHQSIKMNKVLDVSQCSLETSLLYWTFHGVVPLCLLVVLHPKTVPKWLATKEKKSLGVTTIHHPYPPFFKDSLDSLRVAFPIVSNWCAVLGFDRPCRICTSRFIFTWHHPATGLVARDPIPSASMFLVPHQPTLTMNYKPQDNQHTTGISKFHVLLVWAKFCHLERPWGSTMRMMAQRYKIRPLQPNRFSKTTATALLLRQGSLQTQIFINYAEALPL